MRIENFEQLNVRRDHSNQISTITPLKLRRTQPPQCSKNTITNQRQQFEGKKMVAKLLSVTQEPAQDRHHNHERSDEMQWRFSALGKHRKQSIAASNSAKMASNAQRHCQNHVEDQRSHQTNQSQHHD